jgi:hypothetical protein
LVGLRKRSGFVGDPDDIIGMNWLDEKLQQHYPRAVW